MTTIEQRDQGNWEIEKMQWISDAICVLKQVYPNDDNSAIENRILWVSMGERKVATTIAMLRSNLII